MQQDTPPLTSLATSIQSNLNLPTLDNIQLTAEQGIVISQGQPQRQQLQAVPAPAPLPQTEEREVEEVVQSLNVQDEVNEEREAAIILQALQQEGEETTERQSISRWARIESYLLLLSIMSSTANPCASATSKATPEATTTAKATVEGIALTTIEKDTTIRQASVHDEDEILWNVQGDEESEV